MASEHANAVLFHERVRYDAVAGAIILGCGALLTSCALILFRLDTFQRYATDSTEINVQQLISTQGMCSPYKFSVTVKGQSQPNLTANVIHDEFCKCLPYCPGES